MPLIYFTVQKMVLLDGKENRFGTNFLLHLSDHLYSGLCIKMTPFMSYLIGCLYVLKSNAQSTSKLTNSSERNYFFTSFKCCNAHGVPKWVNLQKKMPGSDTYFFEKHIPLGIQNRLNENIRCVA